MSRRPFACVALCLVLPGAAREVWGAAPEADVEAVRTAVTSFAVGAYSSADKSDGNFFFSPISVSLGLGVVYPDGQLVRRESCIPRAWSSAERHR